jgi:glycosyltransferase involved in cell wall biosynthesis
MDLSIIVPGRNEMFLSKTVEDILSHIEGNTEVIVVLDGCTDDTIPKDPRVRVIQHDTSIGQRAATNEAAKLSEATYIMKVDAHCAFDQGFDVKMMKLMEPDITMVPVMRNLHAFDWVCPEGHRRYQGPSGPCTVCGKETTRDIKWIPKRNPQSVAYRFDTDMHFQYWNDWGNTLHGDLTETLSIQGSCFMLTREKYFELDICSEKFSSWGQQGVEVACKTWLSGGRVLVNRTTWYAHMFRTQGGDFSFPYENPQSKVVENRKLSKELFQNNKWEKAVHPFQWLLDKFNPPGWTNVTKGIIYYTDNRLDPKIMKRCQEQIKRTGLPIVSVSLEPMDFGENHVIHEKRGLLTMTKQILKGLEKSKTDVVFFCEHDVLYHPSHFDFTPSKPDVYYYNENSWMLRASDGHCLYYDHKSLSGICAFKKTLMTHYKERIRRIEALIKEAEGTGIVKSMNSGLDISLKEGIHRLGFEPGTHNRVDRIDHLSAEAWRSEFPNVDIKHDRNETMNRWTIDKFRNKPTNWIEAEEIPFWGKGSEII